MFDHSHLPHQIIWGCYFSSKRLVVRSGLEYMDGVNLYNELHSDLDESVHYLLLEPV